MASSKCPWKAVFHQTARRVSGTDGGLYMQLATVRPNGRPANRTVVWRGLLNVGRDTVGEALWFVADRRSAKMADLAAMPYGEVCYYQPTSRVQFRFSGPLYAVVAEHSTHHCTTPPQCRGQPIPAPPRILHGVEHNWQKFRLEAWANQSVAAKSNYSLPMPGEPRTHDLSGTLPLAADGDAVQENKPGDRIVDDEVGLANFCVLLLDVQHVDVLDLVHGPIEREVYELEKPSGEERDGHWSVSYVNA